MSQHKHVWTWPIAGYLFLGGLGAGMAVIAAIGDLFFDLGFFFVPCALGSLVALGLGSFLLIFELGRPTQFWRVFSKQKAILTFGAWMVVVLIIFDALYFSFWLDWIPWSGVGAFRHFAAMMCLLLGCGVLLYTGIELSSMKARVFWNTPALPMLFALSGLLCGAAANMLLVSAWPYMAGFGGGGWVLTFEVELFRLTVVAMLTLVAAALAAATLVAVFIYVLMMYTSSSTGARVAAKRWLNGAYAPAFWGGLVIVGLALPLVLLAFGSLIASSAAMVCIIAGGVFLRFLVVYSDDRRELAGEDVFWKRMPDGSEAFLKQNW